MVGRLYAIGDIHGCPSELSVLLEFLEIEEKLIREDQVVFIGDYIDRGPNSRKVLDILIDFKKQHPTTVFLRGNHEDMLLHFLGFDGHNGDSYLENGGIGTLNGYGINYWDSAQEVKRKFPLEHLSFILKTESMFKYGDFLFVHAGINPSRNLDDQVEEDLYWIREKFLDHEHGLNETVVYGHTPYKDVFLGIPSRIGIDTGLVYGNYLSCLELTQGKIFSIKREEFAVEVRTYDTNRDKNS